MVRSLADRTFQLRSGMRCESFDGVPAAFAKACGQMDLWVARKYCQQSCFDAGHGYAGDDCFQSSPGYPGSVAAS